MPSSSSERKKTRKKIVIALLLATIVLGGVNAYLEAQNASLSSINASLQTQAHTLQANLSALDSEFLKADSQHRQLLVSNASLADRVVKLNSSLRTSAQLVESLHFLSNRTVIVDNATVVVGPATSAFPSTVPMVNFTAKYPGYVIVTFITYQNVGEMTLSVWSSPTACSGHRLFCVTGASPLFSPETLSSSLCWPARFRFSSGTSTTMQ